MKSSKGVSAAVIVAKPSMRRNQGCAFSSSSGAAPSPGAGSTISIQRLPSKSLNVCFAPVGHSTMSEATFGELPSPKWTRGSSLST